MSCNYFMKKFPFSYYISLKQVTINQLLIKTSDHNSIIYFKSPPLLGIWIDDLKEKFKFSMWKVFQMNRANVYSLLHFSLPLNVTCKGFWWAFRQRVDRKLKILLELLTKMLDANDWSSAAPKCICLCMGAFNNYVDKNRGWACTLVQL